MDTKLLLSLPPNLVNAFHALTGTAPEEVFCCCDPAGTKVGSGGGTAHLLEQYAKSPAFSTNAPRILIHAGGQSRRLPSYAPSGKILTPIPVFDWERGQRLSQQLLDLQLPLYRKILSLAPRPLRTLVASGDVYIRAEKPLRPIPEADVVCYGLWTRPERATGHGVFVMSRREPDRLDYMLQKPSVAALEELSQSHVYMMDIGIWLLNDRALERLDRCARDAAGKIHAYDLYAEFGTALGEHPSAPNPDLADLRVAIVPLDGGEFYHFGTSRELLSSMVSIQEKELNQEKILHRKIKADASVFTLNAHFASDTLDGGNKNIWIENSCVPSGWTLSRDHIITGVPQNDWQLTLPPGVCIDMVPVQGGGCVLRPYGFSDRFSGALSAATFLGRPLRDWLAERDLPMPEGDATDIQKLRLFPLLPEGESAAPLLSWMIAAHPAAGAAAQAYRLLPKLSAEEISARADLVRLFAQRDAFRRDNWLSLSRNYDKSIFYQLDLADAAEEFVSMDLPLPESLPDSAAAMQRMHSAMFRSRVHGLKGEKAAARTAHDEAFRLLRDGLLGSVLEERVRPELGVCSDQIVWGRSPVRIDLAGGWTDTPPYSLYRGGSVVNLAINLNGQPPLQVYIRPCPERRIVLRSIDMGVREEVRSFADLNNFNLVGSAFSIAKAALVLSGFTPLLSYAKFANLEELLAAFGCGFELTTFAAIPAGSGLGTSSILASLVLGALNDFCHLGWTKADICDRTLILEQLLTTGGGWQDQWGGVLHGVKLLQTAQGFVQRPLVRWLPSDIFTSAEGRDVHLLYYTGITRVAKAILGEIVEGMFLNDGTSVSLLSEMGYHALEMADAIQRGDYSRYGRLIDKTWQQNKALDAGTNPPEVERLIARVRDYCLGLKLPGAGGGGYLYMAAKDPEAAVRIRRILQEEAINKRARFVDMSLSATGLEISRS